MIGRQPLPNPVTSGFRVTAELSGSLTGQVVGKPELNFTFKSVHDQTVSLQGFTPETDQPDSILTSALGSGGPESKSRLSGEDLRTDLTHCMAAGGYSGNPTLLMSSWKCGSS